MGMSIGARDGALHARRRAAAAARALEAALAACSLRPPRARLLLDLHAWGTVATPAEHEQLGKDALRGCA